jgi:hypothetical protein
MADLYNLLDGLEESQDQPQEEEVEDQQQEQEWEEAEELDVPSALQEAAKRKLPTEDEDKDYELGADLAELSAPKQSLLDLPYTKLENMWSAEMHCPELLPFDQETFDDITRGLQETEERIEEHTAEGITGNATMDALFASLLSVDAERVKFLLCDLLKLRLQKIEAYPLHMREHVDRMTESEVRGVSSID